MAYELRLLSGNDAEDYKSLRLKGLRTDPKAFANSLEQVARRAIDDIAAEIERNIVVGVFNGENKGDSTRNQLVGIGGILREFPGKMNHKGVIYGNYVDTDHRRQGIARRIMVALEDNARLVQPVGEFPAFEELQLRVVKGNTEAKALYESLGYTEFGYSDRAVRYVDPQDGKTKYVGEHFMHKYLINPQSEE